MKDYKSKGNARLLLLSNEVLHKQAGELRFKLNCKRRQSKCQLLPVSRWQALPAGQHWIPFTVETNAFAEVNQLRINP